MLKPTKLTQKRRTKSEKITKSEEQLIVNPEVWINMEKNRALKIKLWKKRFGKKCKSENWLYEALGRL